MTPSVLLQRFGREAGALRDLPVGDILAICGRAGQVFLEADPDGLAPEAYLERAVRNAGLPAALGGMAQGLAVQCPTGDVGVFDTHLFRNAGQRVAFAPRGDTCGFGMPGNHPAPHALWLSALAMKRSVAIRPSGDDVFTPFRLSQALLQAGLPPEALAFAPGGHDLVDALVGACDQAVLFGGPDLFARWGRDPRVLLHGPGQSKVLVLDGAPLEQSAEAIVRLILDDAGRGCLNASAVVVEGDAAPLAREVSRRLDEVPVRSLFDEAAVLGALHPAVAAGVANLVDSKLNDGAWEHTGAADGRALASVEGFTFLRPRVVEVSAYAHPLFGMELPFPFAVFTSCSRLEHRKMMANSLAVVVIGDDGAVARDLLLEPTIDKVLVGDDVASDFNLLEPHQGYLADFLFQKKTFRTATKD